MLISILELRQRLFSQFPLIKFVIEQNAVPVVRRPVDMRWHYEGVIPMSVAGFNPLRHRIFYGQYSFFQNLLEAENQTVCERPDWILYETFFVLHDYMHVWAISKLLPFFPNCLAHDALNNPQAVADLAFILLLSEAVATVSIDWWTLSRIDLSTVLNCDTQFRCLTTSFKMTDLCRAQSINKKFEVSSPGFFEWMATGYCTGKFVGFDAVDPSTLRVYAPWLEKEQQYGLRQRELVSQWVGYLSQVGRYDSKNYFDLTPTRCAAIRLMGRDLWFLFGKETPAELCVSNHLVSLPTKIHVPEFEFVDLAHVFSLVSTLDLAPLTDRQFGFLAAQWLSYTTWDSGSEIGADTFDAIIRNRDIESLRRACGESMPLSAITSNPCVHLFLPN